MINLEWFDGKVWTVAQPNVHEEMIWIMLGSDNHNYRTVNAESGKVITDKSGGRV